MNKSFAGLLVSFFIVSSWACLAFADDWHTVSYESITLPNEDIILQRNEFSNPPKPLDHWRIDSEKDFNAFRNSLSIDGYALGNRTIDFSKNTLLGQSASGGPDAIYFISVTQNDRLKKVKMEVRVGSNGKFYLASFPTYSLNLVLVPKIPADYEVSFSKGKGAMFPNLDRPKNS